MIDIYGLAQLPNHLPRRVLGCLWIRGSTTTSISYTSTMYKRTLNDEHTDTDLPSEHTGETRLPIQLAWFEDLHLSVPTPISKPALELVTSFAKSHLRYQRSENDPYRPRFTHHHSLPQSGCHHRSPRKQLPLCRTLHLRASHPTDLIAPSVLDHA